MACLQANWCPTHWMLSICLVQWVLGGRLSIKFQRLLSPEKAYAIDRNKSSSNVAQPMWLEFLHIINEMPLIGTIAHTHPLAFEKRSLEKQACESFCQEKRKGMCFMCLLHKLLQFGCILTRLSSDYHLNLVHYANNILYSTIITDIAKFSSTFIRIKIWASILGERKM